jgi:hypothetical protein
MYSELRMEKISTIRLLFFESYKRYLKGAASVALLHWLLYILLEWIFYILLHHKVVRLVILHLVTTQS